MCGLSSYSSLVTSGHRIISPDLATAFAEPNTASLSQHDLGSFAGF
jgi:hypothetical protein